MLTWAPNRYQDKYVFLGVPWYPSGWIASCHFCDTGAVPGQGTEIP